jgi:hypothetical protein
MIVWQRGVMSGVMSGAFRHMTPGSLGSVRG